MSDTEPEDISQEEHDSNPDTDEDELNHRFDAEGNCDDVEP
jgi:hypothetical protein